MVKKEERSFLKTALTVIGIISGIISILFFLFLLFIVVSAFSAPTTFSEGNVAVIPIQGVITTQGDSGAFSEAGVVSSQVVDWIHEADDDDNIKAVLFRIDSPGGSPVATDEIATAIQGMHKPSVAVIREIGASGAYWVASATDRIYANRMSMVGSIGVLASYIEFAGTLERYNATYRSLTAGEFKDTGTPSKNSWTSYIPFSSRRWPRIVACQKTKCASSRLAGCILARTRWIWVLLMRSGRKMTRLCILRTRWVSTLSWSSFLRR
jgi:signal peptide peptidase SppA